MTEDTVSFATMQADHRIGTTHGCLAGLADREGLFALKMKMEEQTADEDKHRQEMQRLLG
jgi:hypothetical protein